jgi:hypothetical protein
MGRVFPVRVMEARLSSGMVWKRPSSSKRPAAAKT